MEVPMNSQRYPARVPPLGGVRNHVLRAVDARLAQAPATPSRPPWHPPHTILEFQAWPPKVRWETSRDDRTTAFGSLVLGVAVTALAVVTRVAQLDV
jgi:hypothetical protein